MWLILHVFMSSKVVLIRKSFFFLMYLEFEAEQNYVLTNSDELVQYRSDYMVKNTTRFYVSAERDES